MDKNIVQVHISEDSMIECWVVNDVVFGKKVAKFILNSSSTGDYVSITAITSNSDKICTIPIRSIVMWFYEQENRNER